MTTTTHILGVDVGGVIMGRAPGGSQDTSFFTGDWRATPEIAGALATLTALRESFAGIHVVSKCGENTERKTRIWLEEHGYLAVLTGAHFCRTRRDKAPICEELGVTHFVDDRLEVLGYLESVPAENRFLFGDEEHAELPRGVRRVRSWTELGALLRVSAR